MRLRENNNAIPQVQELPRAQINNDGLIRINLENIGEPNNQDRDGNDGNQDINID